MIDSPTHYWLVMVSDVVWALVFLAVGWAQYTGPVSVAIAAVVAGFLGWELLEYVIHRWVLHGAPSYARRSHARHHGDVHAFISTPILVIALGALATRALFGLVLPSGIATLTVFGLYAGYNYFALLHHLQHHGGATIARVGHWRTLGTSHDLHHHRPNVNYGITTTFWDRAFGTHDPTTRRS
jgi:sterol desaturase/sphingolipid hydroxylase (fatty acid hydroxylase superfamily)